MKIGQIKSLAVRGLSLVGGRALVDRRMLDRNFSHYRRRGIIFVHVPKNAGSAVSLVLYGQSLGHWTAARLQAHAPETFAALDSFAVLRDPVERAYSAWKYCKTGGTAEGWVKNRPEYHIPSFETFERFATEWLPGRDLESLDFVFRSQSSFVCDENGAVIVTRLLPLAGLDAAFPELVAGKPVVQASLPVKNRNMAAREQSAHSSDAIAALCEIYKADVALVQKAVV